MEKCCFCCCFCYFYKEKKMTEKMIRCDKSGFYSKTIAFVIHGKMAQKQ